jgi:hypothetical protein
MKSHISATAFHGPDKLEIICVERCSEYETSDYTAAAFASIGIKL